jgi:hypothetical protein
MATQAEIEAAAAAIRDAMPGLWPEAWPWQTVARAALDAAERVRPRRDLTAAARMRQSRAKRRAERAVTRAVTPERAVTGDVTRAVTRDAAPIDKIDSERASILSSRPLLLASLIEAAGGNVAPGAVDVAPIQVLLAHGCDLDLDEFNPDLTPLPFEMADQMAAPPKGGFSCINNAPTLPLPLPWQGCH